MQLTEESMKVLEAAIPELAHGAFQRAYYEALTTSGKVMRAVDGKLVETYADGTETVIRSIHSPIKVTLGTKITLQHRTTAAR